MNGWPRYSRERAAAQLRGTVLSLRRQAEPGSDSHALAGLGHGDVLGVVFHRLDEGASRLVEDRERAVVAGQHLGEGEEPAAGECRHRAAHGEAVADRHDADFGAVQLVDQRHVGEDVGVAHVQQARLVLEMQHQAVGAAERMRHAVLGDLRGGMEGVDECRRETVERDGAAGVAHLELFDPLVMAEPHAEIIVADDGCAGFPGDRSGVADVVGMAVGEQDMGDVLDRVLAVIAFKGGISGEERIDEDRGFCGFQTERSMT